MKSIVVEVKSNFFGTQNTTTLNIISLPSLIWVKAESRCSDNENDNDHEEKRGILLVELLHAEYAHAHSTNGVRSLCDVIVIVFVAV